MKAGSSATGSIVGSIVGIASLKNLQGQHDPMIYWGLTVLEWNGWFKEEKRLQLQSTLSLSLLIFHKYEQMDNPKEIYDSSKKTTLATTAKSSI